MATPPPSIESLVLAWFAGTADAWDIAPSLPMEDCDPIKLDSLLCSYRERIALNPADKDEILDECISDVANRIRL